MKSIKSIKSIKQPTPRSVLRLHTVVLLAFAVASTKTVSAQSQTQTQTQPGASRFAAGRSAFDKGDFDAAADAFGDAVKASGGNAQYHLWLGNAYAQLAIRSGMLTRARLAPRMREEWIQAARIDPRYYDAHQNLYQFYSYAPSMMGGSAERANAELTTLMRLDPYRAGLLIAAVDAAGKRYAAAESRLAAMLVSYPDSVAIPTALAAAQQNDRHYAEAWSTLDAASARFPGDIAIEYLIGRGAALSGTRLDAGRAALERVVAAPDKLELIRRSGAHYRLGMILQQKGDRSGARTEYVRALDIDPKNADAKKALEALGAA